MYIILRNAFEMALLNKTTRFVSFRTTELRMQAMSGSCCPYNSVTVFANTADCIIFNGVGSHSPRSR